jgi:hypothetical protein
MKRVLMLLILSMMFSGCAATQMQAVPPRVCPSPDKPVYRALDPAEHIGGAKNLEILLLNLSDMAAYTRRLENTVGCYALALPEPSLGSETPNREGRRYEFGSN